MNPGGPLHTRRRHAAAAHEYTQPRHARLPSSASRTPLHPNLVGIFKDAQHHETIYKALYHGGRGGLNRQLTRRRTATPMTRQASTPPQRPTPYQRGERDGYLTGYGGDDDLDDMSELTVRRRRRTLTGEWDDEVFETVFGRIGAWTEHTPIRVGHF